MTTKPQGVSIIIPVYNVEKYLQRCLESVLAQTYSNFEVILINDGSTDNSGNICEEYALKDNRIRVIHCINEGPSKARNIGLDEVNTQWVTFVDSDDYLTPEYLENFFKYNSTDIYTQIVQGYQTVGYNGIENDTLYPSTLYEYHVAKIGKRSSYIEDNNLLYNWAVWCKIFSIEIIRKNNLKFEEDLWSCEDGLFWHNYLCCIKKIIFIEEQGYFYYCPRVYNSVSRNGAHKFTTDNFITLSRNYKRISQILPARFSMSKKYASFLKMYYLNYYFKAILTPQKLTKGQYDVLKEIRPSKGYIILNNKGLVFWLLNLFPIKITRFLFSIIKE